jgi:hypothetical protein
MVALIKRVHASFQFLYYFVDNAFLIGVVEHIAAT